MTLSKNFLKNRKRNLGFIYFIFFLIIPFYGIPFNFASTRLNTVDYRSYYDNNLVLFYGPGLKTEFTVSLEELRNGTYDRIEDLSFTRVNKLNNSYTYQISGSLLWDVVNTSNLLNENATYAQFIGEDGYGFGSLFAKLPIRILKEHNNDIYITTHQNGVLIGTSEGPLRMEVEMKAIENDLEMIAMFKDLFEEGENFVHNSKLSAQRVAAIYISDEPTGFEQPEEGTTNNTITETNTTSNSTTNSTSGNSTGNKDEFPTIPGFHVFSLIFCVVLSIQAIFPKRNKFI
ncbi:hypothetical protein NEF87_005004 [Candidatus Lokiarchaeum ossiferum]|uniref:Uncharacterized protein n=1 Tax=Candidatus Lokiarchaeum ossiferum TaxID=2951803 RepID=A0ABY6I202_9ARCH|nr:hypothetical protein NEF87_005004 [Candidatus Lokiarchaeum sp. B-35]